MITNNCFKSEKLLPRPGCRDVWNAFMCKGASFTENDIPFCPTTATKPPHDIVTWTEAREIYKKALKRGENYFWYDAFVCWYQDDYKFDGSTGIWNDSKNALEILQHFSGIITPDYSTYQDFPLPIKLYNTYRMRAVGYWLGINGIEVINNVRWGDEDSYEYCFDGIPCNSVVAIGTSGGNPKRLVDRKRFNDGINRLVKTLSPHTIVVYGSSNYPCFASFRESGIKVLSYPSHMEKAFERRRFR